MENGQEESQGTHPLVWVAVGCGAVILLGGLAIMTAGYFAYDKAKDAFEAMEENPVVVASKLIAAANPEIEVVEADEENRVITFRNTKTDEEYTIDFEDIEQGRINFFSDDESLSLQVEAGEDNPGSLTVTTDEGTTKFGAVADRDDLPSWLPVYPGTTPVANYTSETAEERTGAYTIETEDDLEDVIDYYVTELEKKGFSIENRFTSSDGAMVTAKSSDGALTVNLAASVDGGTVEAIVNFSEK